jgi:hypothetical protein
LREYLLLDYFVSEHSYDVAVSFRSQQHPAVHLIDLQPLNVDLEVVAVFPLE